MCRYALCGALRNVQTAAKRSEANIPSRPFQIAALPSMGTVLITLGNGRHHDISGRSTRGGNGAFGAEKLKMFA